MNISISSLVTENISETIKLANELGTGIEVSKFADPKILDGNFDAAVAELALALKDFTGKISLHGTFYDLNPVSKEPRVREITTYRYNQSFEAAKAIGAETLVFHTGYNGVVRISAYQDIFIEKNIIFWKDFIKKFEAENITVALENVYEDTPDVVISIIDGVDSPNLKACIDTGHVNISSSLKAQDWIEQIGTRLHHMHIHNNSGIYDEHNSLLKGKVDFNNVVETLMANKLNPNLTLEIFKLEPAMESFNFLRNLVTEKV